MERKRKRIVTTLREDLWRGLRAQAAIRGLDANDILEELITAYLKKAERKGGDR